MKTHINFSLSIKEFNITINKLILHKAPGFNGISPNAIKALDEECSNLLFKIFSEYFYNKIDIYER